MNSPSPQRSIVSQRTSITLHELSHAIAIGLGASMTPDGVGSAKWHFDMRHGPPRNRLPMAFHAKAVAAPAALCRQDPLKPVPLDEVEVPQMADYGYSPLARPVLVFVEKVTKPLLPDEMAHGRTAEGECLFWRLVSTDSCEAAHCGALLTMRALHCDRRLEIVDERSGERVRHFGMINAKRIAPFDRSVMVEVEGVRVVPPPTPPEGARGSGGGGSGGGGSGGGGSGGRGSGKARLVFRSEEAMPRRPSQGGALHQLIYIQTTRGRELLMDFTGPQYGVEDCLAATGTPCWRCEVGQEAKAGYELSGGVAPFSEPQIHPGVLDNQMHSLIGNWVRDSALGVLAHRDAAGLPLG